MHPCVARRRTSHRLMLFYPTTNNEVEYETLITGLLITKGARAWRLNVKCDSQLVVNQVQGKYEAREEKMKAYLDKVRSVIVCFEQVRVAQVPR